VWNEKGERAEILTDGRFEPGEYQAVFDASGLSAGIYVVRFETNGFFEARKIAQVR
jgi:5-hydroxyisourate hydrolase-like protein (transthyretin family)